ncbi:MAG: zinc/iron permease [Candidatus Saganbacteria bacterium]|uniref:Zinc/iron permease n=1 Tax=Candidatus Saganbacteria bacterium TaxID=2575572 RepID=A0A833L2U0_UNCSA|nr:MAG: zinc/iron permease [Candidatus Saganbacteria bacterium]
MVWAYTLLSVLLVSLVSLIGIFFISAKESWLKEILLVLVSFSAGSLLGGAFIHILPEAVKETGFTPILSFYILSGILIFFALEKIIFWRHCHIPTSKSHPHPVTYLNLIGDGFHNFLDGMLIAGSYLASIPLGIATTLAVLIHEVPQEIGDFGVLIYGGFSKPKALALNFASAAAAFIGAFLVLILSLKSEMISSFLLPITAGGFIYIAGSDLIPELKKEVSIRRSLIQFFSVVFGILIMAGLLFIPGIK